MVKSADAIELDDRAILDALIRTFFRRVFRQRQVRSGSTVIVGIARENPLQVPFAEHDHVIEALCAGSIR